MQWKEIEQVINGNEGLFRMLSYYDRTGKMPGRKLVRSFTIKHSNFEKLRSESAKRGRTMSQLIDELIERL
jgi:hypothetical protein